MDSLEFQPQEIKEQGEGMESAAARALDDATYEPLACVEQVGDYQQAEALQSSLEVVVASLPTEPVVESQPDVGTGTEQVGGLPIPIPQPTLEQVSSLSTEQVPSGDLPAVPVAVDSGQFTPGTDKEPGGEGAIPISIPGVQVEKEQVGTIPGPLPEPAEGLGEKHFPKETGAVEAPLPGTGEAGYKEGNEKLNVELPQEAQPFIGVGTEGGVDTSRGSGIDAGKGVGPDAGKGPGAYGGKGPGSGGSDGSGFGIPLDMPLPDDLVTGGEVGQGSKPTIYGNVPGHGGQHYGEGSMPGDPMDGMTDMPTSGGPSSSGSGPAIMGGFGGYTEGPTTYRGVTVSVGGGKAGCDAAADRAVELDRMEIERKVEDGDGASYISKVTCKSEGWVYEYSTDYYGKTQQGPPTLEKVDVIEVKKKSQEPDDSNPTPYTGGSMGPVLPEKDNDTGKVLPDADLGGFDKGLVKGEPGSGDDSGKFYGGIKGDDGKYYPDSGGARPIDPKRKTEDDGKANSEGG